MSAPAHVVIGAGPAGLTAAWHLVRAGQRAIVLEADPEHVGGLARTITRDGQRFDLGPHRFYSKSAAIGRMWQTMLPGGFVEVGRLTRIYYRQRFYDYPLELAQALRNLGLGRALRVGASWAWAKVPPRRAIRSFEDWAIDAFGGELYRTFFKTYTEKVWGMPCSAIDKDWANQRVRGLSMWSVLRTALGRGNGVKSLVGQFLYPRGGAGALWEAVADEVRARGGAIHLGAEVDAIEHDGARVREVHDATGRAHAGEHFHVSMTLPAFVRALRPAPPAAVLEAAAGLRHRDFIVVALLVGQGAVFPDQWIYVHDPGVRVARITNFENWGECAAGDSTRLVAEYFADRGSALWQASDAEIVALARAELVALGLVPATARVTGWPVRVRDAYPVYDHGYRERREVVRAWLTATLRNVYPAGRGGLHNYNSQDHAMMSATLGVRNALEGTALDPWDVNTDHEYAEEGEADGRIEERLVPRARREP